MREVFERIFVGTQKDYDRQIAEQIIYGKFDEATNWAYLLAAKEPFHRSILGYTGKGAPKEHPEYLMARRENALALNLVDAPKPEFFDKRIIDAALDFIEEHLNAGKRVLVCCNLGESRSPSLCLLYLIKHGIIKGETLEDCEAKFLKIYPEYNPGAGMRGFAKEHFAEYRCEP